MKFSIVSPPPGFMICAPIETASSSKPRNQFVALGSANGVSWTPGFQGRPPGILSIALLSPSMTSSTRDLCTNRILSAVQR